MRLIEPMFLDQFPFRYYCELITTETNWERYHAHQGLEFLYVHEGSGTVIIDQHMQDIHSGSLIFFLPYQLHRIHMTPTQDAPYIRSIFVFEPHALARYIEPFPHITRFLRRLVTAGRQSQIINVNDKEYIHGLYRQLGLLGKKMDRTPRTEEACAMFALSMLQYLAAHDSVLSKEEAVSRNSGHHTHEIMNWIEQHYRDEFRLEHLAQHMHLSSYHVSHLFQEATGTSITEYIIARRLRQASWLLNTTERSVAGIAEDVGYSNASYFCQLFKKHIGKTPHQYRLSVKPT
jgi:AraC family transcriptional regulator of arabinose operon